jgi:hypothetical protein
MEAASLCAGAGGEAGMSWSMALAFTNGFLLTVCAMLIVWNIRLALRLHRLNQLMAQIVVKAWVMRHAPIWVPWCIAHGLQFEVNVKPGVMGAEDR